MIFKAKKQIIVEEDIDVDDRIHKEYDIAWQMANIILDNRLKHIQIDLYSERMAIVKSAAERINNAFERADNCIELIRKGEFEI